MHFANIVKATQYLIITDNAATASHTKIKTARTFSLSTNRSGYFVETIIVIARLVSEKWVIKKKKQEELRIWNFLGYPKIACRNYKG